MNQIIPSLFSVILWWYRSCSALPGSPFGGKAFILSAAWSIGYWDPLWELPLNKWCLPPRIVQCRNEQGRVTTKTQPPCLLVKHLRRIILLPELSGRTAEASVATVSWVIHMTNIPPNAAPLTRLQVLFPSPLQWTIGTWLSESLNICFPGKTA